MVVGGLALASVLALLDAVRVNAHGIEYRRQPTYLSYSRVFVTQHGFPWGRLGVGSAEGTAAVPAGVADPGRLTSLAAVYSELVTSDPVRAVMNRSKPPIGTIEAAPVLDPVDAQSALPIVSIAAYSTSPAKAKELARDATNALVEYVQTQQVRSNIPTVDRVDLQVVMRADHATLTRGRSPAMPIVIFAAVLLATIGLCFVLENVTRPSVVRERAARHSKRSVRSAA